jgi:hypothetical protein
LSDPLLYLTGVSYDCSVEDEAQGKEAMYRWMLRQLFALALLVTLILLALSACGGGGQGQTNEPRPLPEVEKALRPSEYRTEEFKPSFSFRVGENWAMETDPPEGPNELEITWKKGTVNLFFLTIKQVYKPTSSGASTEVQAPKDMVGWFQHHPYLKTDKPKPVMVGGVKGVQFHVVVEEDLPKDYFPYCFQGVMGEDPPDCVDIVPLSIGIPLAFVVGIKETVTVLEDVKGETLTIDFGAGAPGTKFDQVATEGQKVVESMKWTGS